VARGLVLAGADRASAPPQKPLANFGILEDVPYDVNDARCHVLVRQGAKVVEDEHGDEVIRGVPVWIIRQVRVLLGFTSSIVVNFLTCLGRCA